MKWLILLFICLIIYYIILKFSEKYSKYQDTNSNENFDPSLVPVSSIVTLAKISQSIVNNNGTLISNGNLQINTPSTPGNLNVTGITKLNTFTGTIGLSAATKAAANTADPVFAGIIMCIDSDKKLHCYDTFKKIWIKTELNIKNISISGKASVAVDLNNNVIYNSNNSLNNWIFIEKAPKNIEKICYDYYTNNTVYIMTGSLKRIYNIDNHANISNKGSTLNLTNNFLDTSVSNSRLFYITTVFKYCPNWTNTTGSVTIPLPLGVTINNTIKISFDGYNDDIFMLSSGILYYADTNITTTPNWEVFPGPTGMVTNISYSNYTLVCLTSNGKIWMGPVAGRRRGTYVDVSGPLNLISISYEGYSSNPITNEVIPVPEILTLNQEVSEVSTIPTSPPVPIPTVTPPSTTIEPGISNPDATVIKFGNGTGWRIKYATNSTTAASKDTGLYIYDTGQVNVETNLYAGTSLNSLNASILNNLNVNTINSKNNLLTVNGNVKENGNELSVKTTGPNTAKLSLFTPSAKYSISAADSSFSSDPNRLQILFNQTNKMIDMYPQTTSRPSNTIILNSNTNASTSLNTPIINTPSITVTSTNATKSYNLNNSGSSFGILQGINGFTVNSSGTGTFTGNLNITGQLNIIPKGTVMMFKGATLPPGWALCNGATVNGTVTPNMTNMLLYAGNKVTGYRSSIGTGDDFICDTLVCKGNAQNPATFVIEFIVKV
jgi:hypothetical protein